jgi:hypothetical protein
MLNLDLDFGMFLDSHGEMTLEEAGEAAGPKVRDWSWLDLQMDLAIEENVCVS